MCLQVKPHLVLFAKILYHNVRALSMLLFKIIGMQYSAKILLFLGNFLLFASSVYMRRHLTFRVGCGSIIVKIRLVSEVL